MRRKGNKDTLLAFDSEQPIGDDTLSRLLPGLDEKLFSRLHGIDHAGLVQGGRAMLEQSGNLERSLFGAALGVRGVADLLGELAAEADKLFKTRGQNQVINAAAAQLRDARRAEKDGSFSVKQWKELQTSLSGVEKDIDGIDAEISEAKRTESKLKRFRRVAGPLAEHRELLKRHVALEGMVLLPEEFGARRQAALDKLSRATERLQKSNSRLDRKRQEVSELEVPQGLLQNQQQIENLQLQLGAFQKSLRDRPEQDAKRRDHWDRAQGLLKSIHPTLPLESVETLKPLLNRKRLIENLARDSGLLKHKADQRDEKQRELTDEMSRLQQELEAISQPAKDVTSLKAAIQDARKAGDLAKMLKRARDAAGQQQQACSHELSRLGRFAGSLEDLVCRAMPERAVLDGFEKKLEEIERETREITLRQTQAKQEVGQSEESLRTLLRSSAVPSIEELQAARGHRDRGWKLIRAKYVDGADPGAAATEYSGGKDLPGAYEQAVLAADDVGDRLRLDAQRVQERLSLETRIQSGHELVSGLDSKLGQLEADRSRVESAWHAVWDGIAGKVGTPKEMKEWLQRVEQLLQKAAHLDGARDEVRSLEATETSLVEMLTAELRKLGRQKEPRPEGLESLLVWCEEVASNQETATRRQGEIKTSLQKLELQLKSVADDRRRADAVLQRWEVTWAEAVDGLGLGTNPHPELALSTMVNLEALFGSLENADAARKQIHGMDQDEERFAAAVAELTQRIGFDVGELTPADVTHSLVSRLGKAQADAARLQEAQTLIGELEEEVAEARQDIQLAEQSLARLRVEAGVASPDEDLRPIEERSKEKRQLSSRIETLQQQLHQSGEGHSIAELEREAQDLDADRVDDELSQLDNKLAGLTSKRDSTRDRRQELMRQIQLLDGSSKAAEAAARAEQLLADIRPDAEQYLRFTIARLILEEQMERYRQDNQTPVLRRAGELFAKLTLGSFSGLRDDLDDKGKPVLLGLRSNRTEVTVDCMSDGTRDQLFLALRLATIELQLDQQDPLPFVVDDILVGFDDERSEAALEVLCELAKKTQVLLFTHHAMVAHAARKLGKENGVFVHDLAA